MIADTRRRVVRVAAAVAGLAKVSHVEWIAVVAVGAPLAVGAFVAGRTRRADVLLRRQAVLIIVDRRHATGGAEVVGRQVQRALAGPAIVGPAQAGIAVEAGGAGLTMRAHGVVLARAALQSYRVAGGGVAVAGTFSTLSFVECAVHPRVAIGARLAGQAGVAGRTVAPFYGGRADSAERALRAELHGGSE